jgi:hypothetical protein
VTGRAGVGRCDDCEGAVNLQKKSGIIGSPVLGESAEAAAVSGLGSVPGSSATGPFARIAQVNRPDTGTSRGTKQDYHYRIVPSAVGAVTVRFPRSWPQNRPPPPIRR